MAHGQNSRKILKVVNGLMIFLGLSIVGLASWALYDGTSVLQLTTVDFPKYAFWAALFFGLFITFISFLGSCSARTDSKLGFAMYIAVVFLALIAQLSAATYLGLKYDVIAESAVVNAGISQDDYNQLPAAVRAFEQAIIDEASSNEADWIKTQNLLGCCGYDALRLTQQSAGSDVIDNGALCNDNQVAIEAAQNNGDSPEDVEASLNADGKFFCKGKVVAKLENYALYVGIVAGVLAFVQFVCLLAASRVACCVSKKDGGYMQDWRPSTRTREEEYAATDLTGMGAASGGPMVGQNV